MRQVRYEILLLAGDVYSVFGTWVAIVSLALPPGASTSAALSVVAGCLCLGIVVFGGYALAFSTTTARRLYASAWRWLEGALVMMFGFAGIKLLLSRL